MVGAALTDPVACVGGDDRTDPASIDPIAAWDIPRLPLKGGAIVARGVEAGPEVARILQTVEAKWIAEGFPGDARVAAILDEVLEPLSKLR